MAFGGYDSFYDWYFTDRKTGEIVIAQKANWQLLAFYAALVLTIVLAFFSRPASLVAGGIAAILLVWWALLEIFDGANPWRQTGGIMGLIFVAVSAYVMLVIL